MARSGGRGATPLTPLRRPISFQYQAAASRSPTASGATMLVANLQYSGIVFAGLFGLVIFGDRLPLIGWLGLGLIVLSGITATVLRSRAVPHAPAEEH